MDPKTKNFLKFILKNLLPFLIFVFLFLKYSGESDPLRIIGWSVTFYIFLKTALYIHTWVIKSPKPVTSYGKWAIITGSTSGIGFAFAKELASRGMNLLLISRSQDKLTEQTKELEAEFHVSVRNVAFNFSAIDKYASFSEELRRIVNELQGGVGLLINNVGVANEIPVRMEDMTDDFATEIINVNCYSSTFMTRVLIPHMKSRKTGAIIFVSSASATHPTAMLSLYGATKSFMRQLSKAISYELEEFGVETLVITPYYFVSNIYKPSSKEAAEKGTLLVPIPEPVVKSTLNCLGRGVLEAYPYWSHAALGAIAKVYWETERGLYRMMVRNLKRYEEKKGKKKD